MKALALTFLLTLAAFGSGAYALVHGIENTVATATRSNATARIAPGIGNQVPEVATVVAML